MSKLNESKGVVFSPANRKLRKLYTCPSVKKWLSGSRKIYSLDLLSGICCPFANKCKSQVVIINNRRHVKDGPNTEFRCYSASEEALYTGTYNLRKKNLDILRKSKTIADISSLLQKSLPANAGIVRIHASGDFFNQRYFDAWMYIVENNPDILFYAYTKSLPYWTGRLDVVSQYNNLVLTASRGGTHDSLIDEYKLREAVVVYSKHQAKKMRLEIDKDDSHAANPSKKDKSFALLIHGVQPKGSEAAKALQKLKGKQ